MDLRYKLQNESAWVSKDRGYSLILLTCDVFGELYFKADIKVASDIP